MSYDVVICNSPIAAHDKTAWKELVELIEQTGRIPAVFRRFLKQVTARYPCMSEFSEERIDDAVWSSGPLRRNLGHRAIPLNISYPRVDEVVPFLITTANELGLFLFDSQTGWIHRPDGIQGLSLTLENQAVLNTPTLSQVRDAVDRMTPDGGPAFLVLDGWGNDFAQAAGGKGVFTAEWRESRATPPTHWVAGQKGKASKRKIRIPTNGAYVSAMSNERLSASDVKAILAAFAKDKGRPNQFQWRDVSDQYV